MLIATIFFFSVRELGFQREVGSSRSFSDFTSRTCVEGGVKEAWRAKISERKLTSTPVGICLTLFYCHILDMIFIFYPMLSCTVVSDSATPWTVAHQAPLSMGFSRQEYWSGLPCPTPGDLADPGIEPTSPASPALAGRFFTTEQLGKPCLTL